jgi:hypothetical protein
LTASTRARRADLTSRAVEVVITGGVIGDRLRDARVRGFITDARVALDCFARAIALTAATCASGADIIRGAEGAIVTCGAIRDWLRYARASGFIADAHVALVIRRGAVTWCGLADAFEADAVLGAK